MILFKLLGYALLAYIGSSLLVFGHPLGLLGYAILPVHLGAPLWQVAALFGVGLSAAVFFPMSGKEATSLWLAAIVAWAQILAVVFVAIYAETWRSVATVAFATHDKIEQSFFLSIYDLQQEFFRPVHAAVLKDCVPYAWSYRKMAFFRLEPGVAVNVLPGEWLKRCSIKRPD